MERGSLRYGIAAVIKQFAGGLGGSEEIVANEVELQQQQKLEKLYISTRSAKVTHICSVSFTAVYRGGV
ncbi:hypothetical protein Tco_0834021 [Tanacetum coccineum]